MAHILLMFALWSLGHFPSAFPQFEISFIDRGNCKEQQYFQFSSLSCQSCGLGQRRSSDNLSCICRTGFKLAEEKGGPDTICENCNDGGFVNYTNSFDGTFCVRCPDSIGFNIKTGTCNACPENSIATDRGQNGKKLSSRMCVSCVEDTSPSIEGTHSGICKRCPSHFFDKNRTECSCIGANREMSGGVCFEDTSLIPENQNMFKVKYGDKEATSYFFRRNLRAAQALCKEKSNLTACQLLGNLCVMLVYNTNLDACKEYSKLVTAKASVATVRQNTDWPTVMPWLFYSTNDPEAAVLNTNDIKSKFQANGELKFVVAVYTPNGSFVGYQYDLSSLQLCNDRPSRMAAASKFATTYQSSCSIPVKELKEIEPMFFYDLFLHLDGGRLYAIPLLVDNINVNKENDAQKWILTRRFYIVDNLGGKTAANKKPEHMHYAAKIQLKIRLRSSEGEIFPPLLQIMYEALDLSDETENSSKEVSFSISYEMDTEKIEDDTKIAIGCLSAVATLLAVARVVAWRRRHGSEAGNFDLVSFFKFVLFLFSTLSTMYFWIIFGLSVQWLIFFKRQSLVYRLLPTPSQEKLFLDLFVVVVVFNCVDVLHMFWSQISIDIFFIDWERPRGRVSEPTQAGEPGNLDSPISIWRTLFIANEWNEIQTLRKVNPELQLFLVLFFLKVVGFEYLATTDPQSRFSADCTTDYVGEYSRVLRFAVLAIVFLAVECVQWFFFAFIYERFVSDALGGFVDLCSMSNVSIFILENARYGFYIHGRSVHGCADTNMWLMNENLKREEDDLCEKRGLEPNSEQQTFEVEVPGRFRDQYDQVIAPLRQRDQQRERRNVPKTPAGQGGRTSRLTPSVERSLQSYGALNRFLSAFIDHAVRDLDYLVRDKLLFEQILSMELKDLPPPDRAIFYNDNGRSFNKVLFYGNEWTLMLFELLVFAAVDLISEDFVLGGVLTYIISKGLAIARNTFGRKNLARKTLVDERFLI